MDNSVNNQTHITNLKGRFRVETSDPASPISGDMYFNTATNYLAYYNGSAWVGFLFS